MNSRKVDRQCAESIYMKSDGEAMRSVMKPVLSLGREAVPVAQPLQSGWWQVLDGPAGADVDWRWWGAVD